MGRNDAAEFNRLLCNAVGAWKNNSETLKMVQMACQMTSVSTNKIQGALASIVFLFTIHLLIGLVTAPVLRMAPMWPRNS